MTVFTGHTGNAGHFLQPTASAMGHRTTPFSQGSRQLAYALSRVEPRRAHALTHVIAGVRDAASDASSSLRPVARRPLATCGAQIWNRSWHELGSLCEWAVALATDRTGPSTGGERKGGTPHR